MIGLGLLQTSRSLCGEKHGLLFVICWIRISRERLIFNKGGLFLNKGGLLENKGWLLRNKGALLRRAGRRVEVLY